MLLEDSFAVEGAGRGGGEALRRRTGLIGGGLWLEEDMANLEEFHVVWKCWLLTVSGVFGIECEVTRCATLWFILAPICNSRHFIYRNHEVLEIIVPRPAAVVFKESHVVVMSESARFSVTPIQRFAGKSAPLKRPEVSRPRSRNIWSIVLKLISDRNLHTFHTTRREIFIGMTVLCNIIIHHFCQQI